LELDDRCTQKNGYFDEYARRTPGIMDGNPKNHHDKRQRDSINIELEERDGHEGKER
jgi:hypothetical protein